MKIIVFRFHNNFELCKHRLEGLKALNSDVEIYGLYGGDRGNYDEAQEKLKDYLEDTYFINNEDPYWKWKNGDLCLKEWYQNFGKSLDFQGLY